MKKLQILTLVLAGYAAIAATPGVIAQGRQLFFPRGSEVAPGLAVAGERRTGLFMDDNSDLAVTLRGNTVAVFGASGLTEGAPPAPPSDITGTGTADTVTRWTAATVVGDSNITDDGTDITLTGADLGLIGNVNSPAQIVVVDDTGDASAALGTITPTSSFVELDCDDTGQQPGCIMSLSETGAVEGQRLTVVLASTTFSVEWPDEAGVMLGTNPSMQAVGDSVEFVYSANASLWFMTSHSINQRGNFRATLADNRPNSANAVWQENSSIKFEGATANGFEIALIAADVGADANLELYQEGSSGVGLRFVTVTLHTNLPAAGNGTILWCSNCDPVSTPCTTGGASTGNFAFRENDAWNCK